MLTFANFVPVLVLAPWAGSVADRFDRRHIVFATQAASSAVSAMLAALVWLGLAPVWVVIVCGLGLGVGSAFGNTASMALVGDLVPRHDLGSAVALNSMTYNLARAVGPALAGVSVHVLGIGASFAINSGSYLLLVVGVLVVRKPPSRPRPGRAETRIRDSLKLLREQPQLAAFLLIVSAVGIASDPVNTEAPAFARAYGLGSLDTWTGAIIGMFGAGAVAAALVLAGRIGSARTMRLTLALLGCGVIGFAVAPWIGLGGIFLFVAGFGYLASNTSATSRLQLGVEDHQRGRIMALWSIAFLGFRPVASLADGAIASAFGVRVAGVCLALPALAGAALITFVQRRNRSLTSEV